MKFLIVPLLLLATCSSPKVKIIEVKENYWCVVHQIKADNKNSCTKALGSNLGCFLVLLKSNN